LPAFLNNSELVLNICGCGHLTETFLLPALEQVINQVPDLRQKLKLILTDAASIYELAGTKNGAGIESVLRNMRVDYEYCASGTLGMDRLSSIKGVFNATPPALHLPTCEYYVGNTGAPIYNEKPACLPDEIDTMANLAANNPDRINHIDWVMGTAPFQWLMSKVGQDLLRRFGDALLVNSYCVESWAVDSDRNGLPGQYGLLQRNKSVEDQKGFDLGVGIANDCGIHAFFSALLFEQLTKSEKLRLDVKGQRVRYARALRDHPQYQLFDDTAGALTFFAGKTCHNVIFGKELNSTFFGFDAVNKDFARLLVCFGVPKVTNPREPDAAEIPPYIVYVPGPDEKGAGECHVFDYRSDSLYVGMVVNFIASALKLSDHVRPNFPTITNKICLTGVHELSMLKKRFYDIASYEEYEVGSRPKMIPPFSRDFGLKF
jgi:hypothetical protein